MPHYDRTEEEKWKEFRFRFPYPAGLKRLREEVLSDPDFDPAVLWVWGTMQATAVLEVLKACEREFGERGQRVVREALRGVGLEVGRQILEGTEWPEGMTEAELASFYATVINCVVYASLEDPSIDGEDRVSFHILWCPHQDLYGAFDCRVQRYFVQGMLEALKERGWLTDWQVRFTRTIPAGAETCHFELWKAPGEEAMLWESYSEELERKALRMAAAEREREEGEGD
ncbi:hypothetical protein [Candidatus Solincola tengchongensis]|uniref:hypothetical protein n=1 Tax=Candidatus Solincola tengchongensis TaxID=2900693 RepID=UPI00257E158C|nr:hypothetical protein [Candidatus Solincola tengchongensis]